MINVSSVDGASRQFTARDVSLGGLRLEVPMAGMLGGNAPFRIEIPVGHESVLCASAVLRCTTTGVGDRPMAHLAFLDRSEPFQSALAASIGRFLVSGLRSLDDTLERLGGTASAPGRRGRAFRRH